MGYIDLKKDLPERTIDILEKYEGEYNVTLLINCLTALLILPREMFFDRIPDVDIQNLHGWGLKEEHAIKVRCDSCGYNLKDIVRNMRNALAHMSIDVTSNDERQIDKVKFKGKQGKFELDIPVADLKTFVIKLARCVIERDSQESREGSPPAAG
jgi:hypothetical protein